MFLFYEFLKILTLILIIVIIYSLYKMLLSYNKSKKKINLIISKNPNLSKYKSKYLKKCLLNTKTTILFDFVRLCVYDLINGKDYFQLFGIWAFTGYYGQGKTLGCVSYAKKIQERYPLRHIQIISNIDIKNQLCRVTSWEEILDITNKYKNVIMIYDESQNDFNCNNQEFPTDFLRQITQMRKKQFAFYMTSPRFNRMNINIRESCNFIVECKNILKFDRLFQYTFYHTEDYEEFNGNKFQLFRHKAFTNMVIAYNNTYKMYNTVEFVKSIKDNLKTNNVENNLKMMNNKIQKLL